MGLFKARGQPSFSDVDHRRRLVLAESRIIHFFSSFPNATTHRIEDG
jgi:hypothetical protein